MSTWRTILRTIGPRDLPLSCPRLGALDAASRPSFARTRRAGGSARTTLRRIAMGPARASWKSCAPGQCGPPKSACRAMPLRSLETTMDVDAYRAGLCAQHRPHVVRRALFTIPQGHRQSPASSGVDFTSRDEGSPAGTASFGGTA